MISEALYFISCRHIFFHNQECTPFGPKTLPARQLGRLMSLKGYDFEHMLAAAEIVEGNVLNTVAGTKLADGKANYINVHNAKPGWFAARNERA